MTAMVSEFVTYRQTSMEHDVRRYMYFLIEGQYPVPGSSLPTL